MKSSLKPFLYFLFGGLLLSLLSLVIWIAVNGSHTNILFGRVVDVTNSTITIANKQNEQTIISVATSTSIARNQNELRIADIGVGNFVQVTVTGDEEIAAESIRLMRPPREDSNYGPGQ